MMEEKMSKNCTCCGADMTNAGAFEQCFVHDGTFCSECSDCVKHAHAATMDREFKGNARAGYQTKKL